MYKKKKKPFIPRKVISDNLPVRKIDEDDNIVETFETFNYGADEIVLVPNKSGEEYFIRNLTPEEISVLYVSDYGVYRKVRGNVKIAFFDIDIYRSDSYNSLSKALEIEKRIANLLNIPYSVKFSGNKGLHIYFSTDADIQNIKNLGIYLNVLLGNKIIDVGAISDVRLVPSIYSPHRKTGRFNISVLRSDTPHNILQISKSVVYRGEEIPFVSDKDISDVIEDIKGISHEKYKQLYEENQLQAVKYIINTDRKLVVNEGGVYRVESDVIQNLIKISPPCIRFSLMNANPEHNTRWLIVATLHHLGLEFEDLLWLLSKWFSDFDEKKSSKYVEYVIQKYDKPFFCRTFRRYGVCPFRENKCGVKKPIEAFKIDKLTMLDEIDVNIISGIQ